jgi:ribonuclease J
MKSSDSPLKIIPLGGIGEIGLNCMVLESQSEILIVDCGLLFSDLDHFGVEFIVPDFTYLKERRDKVKGFLITHGHEDHIGALAFAFRAGIDAPIYCSSFTSLLIRERFKEAELLSKAEVRVFKMGETIEFDEFKVRPESVNHSIVDAAALFIDTPVGRIIHTGDFKIDPMPFIGTELDQSVFAKAGDEGVLLLLSDSTNAEHHEHSMSEGSIYQHFEKVFSAAEGLIVVSMFASNVARMSQVFDIARKMGKKIALMGRTMEQNVGLGQELGYIKNAQSLLVPIDQLEKYKRSELIVLSTGCQGEYRSALTRMAMGEDRNVKLAQGDLVVMSSKMIPGNEKAIGRVINELFKQGAHVLYESIHELHVSGHACRPELRKMLDLTRPKFFIPIHGEYRHLVHHSEVAAEAGLTEDRIRIIADGDVVELTPDSCEVKDKIEDTRVLIEGREGNDITRLVLKDRRKLGETGVVFTLMVRLAESRRILSGPEIILKGIANESVEALLIDEAKALVKRLVEEYELSLNQGHGEGDLQETVRVELRRLFNQNVGKKPVVMPIILDI